MDMWRAGGVCTAAARRMPKGGGNPRLQTPVHGLCQNYKYLKYNIQERLIILCLFDTFSFISIFVEIILIRSENMKLTKPFLFVSIILLGCASCKNKAGTIEQENAELGTEEINDSVHQAQGIVMDATMNGFTMVTSKKDTLYISTMDRNIALEKGLLIGDTLEVSYTVTEDEPGINIASAITKIH